MVPQEGELLLYGIRTLRDGVEFTGVWSPKGGAPNTTQCCVEGWRHRSSAREKVVSYAFSHFINIDSGRRSLHVSSVQLWTHQLGSHRRKEGHSTHLLPTSADLILRLGLGSVFRRYSRCALFFSKKHAAEAVAAVAKSQYSSQFFSRSTIGQ